MHPLDCLICGWQVVYDVGLTELICDPLGWPTWLPLSLLLYQWDAELPPLIPNSNQYWFALACDEEVLFLVHGYAVIGVNGDGAVV